MRDVTRFQASCGMLAVGLVSASLMLSAQEPPKTTTLDKVFSQAQADRGAGYYDAECSHCHEGGEPAAAPPRGDDFVDHWREAPLTYLFTHISTNMPGDKPGSLPKDAYVDLVAYLLSENHYPAGEADLTADRLAAIQFVGHEGPRPLAAGAMVRVAGCLTSANGAWTLARGTAPVRVRSGDRTTPEEVAQSAASPAGTGTYTLRPGDDVKLDPLAGQRVQIKGVWNGTSGVSALSAVTTGTACGS